MGHPSALLLCLMTSKKRFSRAAGVDLRVRLSFAVSSTQLLASSRFDELKSSRNEVVVIRLQY